MKLTNNGLDSFDKERCALLADAKILKNLCDSGSGHLGDVIGGLKTIIQSIELKVDSLSKEFKNQKNS